MKRIRHIVAVSALALLTLPVCAQKNNSLRVGSGVEITTWESYSNWIIGPSLYMEYARKFNKFFSLSLESHVDALVLDKWNSQHHLSLGVSGLVRPFAFVKWLDWIEAGMTIVGCYNFYSQDRTGLTVKDGVLGYYVHEIRHTRVVEPGFGIPIRLYMIDNDKFECLAFINFEFAFYKVTPIWTSTDCGIMFGVKF